MLTADEHRLAIWIEAASWALARKQPAAAQRLLSIALDAAVRSGYPEVAEHCRTYILGFNAQHLIRKIPSALEAVQNEDFIEFLDAAKRQLPFEEAERMVLSRPADDRPVINDQTPLGPQLLDLLGKA